MRRCTIIPETDAVRLALGYAHQYAEHFGEDYVIAAHLLVALITIHGASAERLLFHIGAHDLEGIAAFTVGRFFTNDQPRAAGSIRLEKRVTRIIQHAHNEARQQGNERVTTAHYLVGCLCVPGNVADTLNRFGAELGPAREALGEKEILEADDQVGIMNLKDVSKYKLW